MTPIKTKKADHADVLRTRHFRKQDQGRDFLLRMLQESSLLTLLLEP